MASNNDESIVKTNGVTSDGVGDAAAAAAADDFDPEAFPPDPEEEKAAQEFKEQCAREMKAKLDALGSGFKHNVEQRFVDLETRYGEHKEINKAKQTDVLRLNKITRDVSRALGADWKGVFTFIMAGCEKDVIDRCVADIEKQRPFMQAYKALMTWRDVGSSADQGVDVDKLIEALQIHDKASLADHVKAILYSEGDELLQIGKLSADVAPAKTSVKPATSDAAAAGGANSTSQATHTSTHAVTLDDRKLLQLAKKIGPSWFELASLLGLADDDVSEVKGSEGTTYQGAFKVMWIWRDRTLDDGINQQQVLAEALRAASMADVADLL